MQKLFKEIRCIESMKCLPSKVLEEIYYATVIATTTYQSCIVYEFSCRCEAWYVGRTTQRLAGRIQQHVPTSIRKKSNTVKEQPPHLCKNNNYKINCESAIGQHLLTNPECAKTYTDDNFRIIGQARSSFHLSVLESVYIKTQNLALCKQKDFIFSLGIFK